LRDYAADADFVVCAATATAESRGMFDAPVFAAMKRSAMFVNVGRGGVVNEPDLIAALRDETIAGAGLDVFADEPVSADHPLLAMEQVICTPHIGGVTRQSYDGIAGVIAGNVGRLRSGRELLYCATPQPARRA
jgi:phosphoglycerate dehydrogenase-like enzyme